MWSKSPKKILIRIALIILSIEFVIQIIFDAMDSSMSSFLEALMDGVISIILTIPLIYFLAISPFARSRQNAINALRIEKKQVEQTAEDLRTTQKNLLTLTAGMDKHSLISITDLHGIITYVNEKFCTVSGYEENELIGSTHRILNSHNQPKNYWKKMFSTTSMGDIWQDEVRNKTKDGAYYWVDTTIIPIYESNQLSGYLSIRTDITELKKQQEELAKLAHHDELTNLPNRTLFNERFRQAMAQSHRSKTKVAICFFDLNEFKAVNDNYGHDVGDVVLIEIAKRLSDCLREVDTVSRQGGDEFVVILSGIHDEEEAKQTVDRIQHAIQVPIIVNELSLSITAASGIAIYRDDGEDIETLLRQSDKAMYKNKLSKDAQ